MDFNRYCRSCGHHVNFTYGDKTGFCPVCDKEITRADTIEGYRRDIRIRQLKAMHELMCRANDEDIYYTWVYTMPDQPSEDDFKEIAMNDKAYNECFDAFTRLIVEEGNRW